MDVDTQARERFDFFASWSGGKDSCLALYRMIRAGHACVSLFTMIDENGEFHTFVYDGPLFKHRVDFSTGGIFEIGNHSVLPIITKSETEVAI